MKYFQQKCEEKYEALGQQELTAHGGVSHWSQCRLEGAGWMDIPHQAAPNEPFGCCGQAWGALATQAQSDIAPNVMIISVDGYSPQADFAVRFGAFVYDYNKSHLR